MSAHFIHPALMMHDSCMCSLLLLLAVCTTLLCFFTMELLFVEGEEMFTFPSAAVGGGGGGSNISRFSTNVEFACPETPEYNSDKTVNYWKLQVLLFIVVWGKRWRHGGYFKQF